MSRSHFQRVTTFRFGSCLSLLTLFSCLQLAVAGDNAKPASIRLVPQVRSQIRTEGLPLRAQGLIAQMPENFYHFGATTAGKVAEPQTLTFQFAAPATISEISTSRDFTVLAGGSCEAGRSYTAGQFCQLTARFTPQGAGNRLGKLTFTTSDGDAINFSLLGYSYVPVISFTPSVINTVPATVSAGAGLISGAYNLAIDSGDSLFIADTGHGEVRYMDSSGILRNVVTGVTTPTGITLDTFGNVYFTNGAATGAMYEVYNYATFYVTASGTGTDICTVATNPPCLLGKEQLHYPGMLSTDGFNNIFWANDSSGAAMSAAQPLPATYYNLYSPFTYQETLPDAIAVDSNDNIYSLWAITTECTIKAQTLFDAEQSLVYFYSVAGGRTCGYSGDGGKAVGAEIGNYIGQMAFDTAGNLYFTDTKNQRVRRIDAATGIIRTIAGNGIAGYTGDNGPATSATLRSPAGLTVDSEGQVYILSNSAATGSAQVVRKIGIAGDLVFPSTVQGVASATALVNVANTGNAAVNFVRETITGANAADFTIDPNNTSCDLVDGGTLPAGQDCRIGVIFKPSAVGARTATINLLDNTVTTVNRVNLTGTGVAAAKVQFTAPATTQVTSGASITVAVKVTSGYATPTGKVTFSIDGKVTGSSTLASGVASLGVGTLASGTHSVLAAYSGDKYHAAAKASETLTVSK